MGKRGRSKGSGRKPIAGEQMPLIDVGPENLKEIEPVAREYREIVLEGRKLLKREIELKNNLHELIKKANLKRLPDGNIRFTCEGLVITVKYRDELIQVKELKTKKIRGSKKKGMAETVADTEDQIENEK